MSIKIKQNNGSPFTDYNTLDLQGINLTFFGNKFGLCGIVNIVSRINYDDVQRLKIAPLSASFIVTVVYGFIFSSLDIQRKRAL